MNETSITYRVYGYRWVVLALYGLATVVIQLMWTTFFSITTEAWQFYGFADAQAGENAISMLSVIFMVGMIVLSVPTMAIFEKAGFKKSVGFGVVLTGLCALARGVWGASFPAVVAATVGFAVAQPFILNAPGLVAGKWFPENERATANSVGMLCNYVGMCVGLLLTPLLLQGGCDIRAMLMIYGAVGAVTAVLFVIFVKEQPPTPPCAPELAVRESFGAGMKSAMKKRGFVVVLVVFFFLMGVFNIFFTMIEPILKTCSGGAVDATQVGVAGVLVLVAGIVGSLVISMASDKDAKRRRLPYAIGANVIGVIGLALFVAAKNLPMILAAAVLYGGFTVGSAPLLMTFAAEETYPTSEGTSEGLLMFVGNIAGALFIAGAGLFGGNYRLMMIVLTAISLVCILPLLPVRESKLQK